MSRAMSRTTIGVTSGSASTCNVGYGRNANGMGDNLTHDNLRAGAMMAMQNEGIMQQIDRPIEYAKVKKPEDYVDTEQSQTQEHSTMVKFHNTRETIDSRNPRMKAAAAALTAKLKNTGRTMSPSDQNALDWNREGLDMLSKDYMRGFGRRLFQGEKKNVAEHKKLIHDLNYLKRVRQQELVKIDRSLNHERQTIIRETEEIHHSNLGAKKTGTTGSEPFRLPRLQNTNFIHRKTQLRISEVALLAQTGTHVGHRLRLALADVKDKLWKYGVAEEEKREAELLLELCDSFSQKKDDMKRRSDKSVCSFRSTRSSLGNGRARSASGSGSVPGIRSSAYGRQIQEVLMANQRKELLRLIVESTKERQINKRRCSSFSGMAKRTSSNAKAQVQVPASTVSLAENQKIAHEKTKEQLYLQSRILQSHPFVTQAVLLGLPVPLGIGGVGGKEFGQEIQTIQEKPKVQERDSFELLEEEVKPGYCTMLQVCKSMNFLETKSINDRVRKFNRQIATFNDATKAATNKSPRPFLT